LFQEILMLRNQMPGRLVLAVTLAAWWGPGAAQADDATVGVSDEPVRVEADTPLWSYDPLIVTALGYESSTYEAPYITDTIEQDDIRGYGFRTTPESLKWTPGVMVQKTAPGQSSPYIRGFTGFRNVFLIDGVRLNNSTFRSGPNQYWSTVDPFSLERLEVIKGPSSVLYGSDAIGGVVNAITRSPYTYSDADGFGGNAYGRVATAEQSLTGRLELSFTPQNNLGFLGGVTGNDFGDLEGGREVGEQPGTAYEQYGADFKAEYFFHEDTRLVFAHQRYRQNNAPRTHRTVDAIMWENLTQGTDLKREFDQERELTYVQLHAEQIQDGPFDALKFGVSWQEQWEQRDRVRGNGVRELQSADVGTFGLFAQAQSQTDWGLFTYGFDYYHDNVDSASTTSAIQGPVGDDATYDLLGVYAQWTLDLSDRTRLVLGGRWNYAAADADSVQDPVTGNQISVSDEWNKLVGSVRLHHDLQPDRLAIFGGVSQGFRAPNLSDITRLDTARTNEIETPSPGLEPENYLSFEAGFKGRGQDYGWQASYFYTLIDDQIIRFPTGNTIGPDFEVTKDNIGEGYVNGIELDGVWRLAPNTTLFGNGTYLMGEVDTFPTSTSGIRREYISRLMPLTINAGVRYQIPDTPIHLYTVGTFADKADKLSTRDQGDTSRIPPGGTPSYFVLNVGGGWQIKDNLELNVTIENLFNEDYRVHGSGLNAPGTNVIFGLDYTF
jgi:hemoglobin/transferrin/lactoferrin receptor protein